MPRRYHAGGSYNPAAPTCPRPPPRPTLWWIGSRRRLPQPVRSHAHRRAPRRQHRIRKKEQPASLEAGCSKKPRQRPTLPQSFPCSTIGPGELNFRVRDGNGCGLSGIAAGKKYRSTSGACECADLVEIVWSSIRSYRPESSTWPTSRHATSTLARPRAASHATRQDAMGGSRAPARGTTAKI